MVALLASKPEMKASTATGQNWVPEHLRSSLRACSTLRAARYGRSVVIDDQILYEGDKIYDATITKINKSEVQFEKNGFYFTKYLNR